MSLVTARVLIYDTRALQRELLVESLKSCIATATIESLEGSGSLLQKVPSGDLCVVLFADVYHHRQEESVRLMAQLKAQFPAVPFIVCVQAGHTEQMVEAFRLGAAGIIYSDENLGQLAKCIECVARGEIWVKRTELRHVLQALPRNDAMVTDSRGRRLLTPREEQVTSLIVQGFSNREISDSLNIAESTVKNYVFHTFEKLGVSNRVELARYVNENTRASATVQGVEGKEAADEKHAPRLACPPASNSAMSIPIRLSIHRSGARPH